MATTEVQICNMALANIGKPPVVASLRPPDASQQAQMCALYYDPVLDALIEAHDWGFVTKQVQPAPATNPSQLWAYAYAVPSDFIRMAAVYAVGAQGDVVTAPPVDYPDAGTVSATTTTYDPWANQNGNAGMQYGGMAWPFFSAADYDPWWFTSFVTQENYSVESDAGGNLVLYTNEAAPLIKYVGYPVMAGTFPPLFVMALSWALGAQLAGAMIRGDEGVVAARSCAQNYELYLRKAQAKDCQNRVATRRPMPAGIKARFVR